MEELLYKGHVRTLLRRLEQELRGVSLHGPGTKEKREVLKRVIAYLEAGVKLMDYGRLRKEDLVIASGVVEGAARYVVGERLDNSGMRWIEERAEAVRREGTVWAVAGRKIEVVELPDVAGEELELTVKDGEHTLLVDGERSFGSIASLERPGHVVRARRVEGGYRLTGRWPFSSGVDYSTWNMFGAVVSDEGTKPGTEVE